MIEVVLGRTWLRLATQGMRGKGCVVQIVNKCERGAPVVGLTGTFNVAMIRIFCFLEHL
jgi:hypothetical protein